MSSINGFSEKQLTALTWWCSRYRDRSAIICDGAVRSGKTLCLALSFVLWASVQYSGRAFALCGKTIGAVWRNVVEPLLPLLRDAGFACREHRGRNTMTLTFAGHDNVFHLFGGRDESSSALVQGMTLQGVLFDEVALMPRSFVEQALARCSDDGARFFFCCNPSHPRHWFYEEWVCRAHDRNALYLHFTMDDNPALSGAVRERYASLYSGAFYDRFVRGLWTRPEGLVYPMFSRERHIVEALPERFDSYRVSCDYGTANPCSMGLWGQCGDVWYRVREFYHDARREGYSMTDDEYADALERLCDGCDVDRVVIDPSAASFIECVRRRGRFVAERAVNDVDRGIRRVMELLHEGRLLFHAGCADAIREFSLYRWHARTDSPLKQDDHAMDDIRYFAMDVTDGGGDDFFVVAPTRRTGG